MVQREPGWTVNDNVIIIVLFFVLIFFQLPHRHSGSSLFWERMPTMTGCTSPTHSSRKWKSSSSRVTRWSGRKPLGMIVITFSLLAAASRPYSFRLMFPKADIRQRIEAWLDNFMLLRVKIKPSRSWRLASVQHAAGWSWRYLDFTVSVMINKLVVGQLSDYFIEFSWGYCYGLEKVLDSSNLMKVMKSRGRGQ